MSFKTLIDYHITLSLSTTFLSFATLFYFYLIFMLQKGHIYCIISFVR
nr:MAG TPA: hypothetical protein [Caudoviricetes sp.]DAS68423.1 MAG TPA: hypothetical protein [Caudoviricetes sp.]